MENNQNEKPLQKATAPLADKNHQLDPAVTGKEATQQEEVGKLPDNELGVDHNSDPVIAKNQ